MTTSRPHTSGTPQTPDSPHAPDRPHASGRRSATWFAATGRAGMNHRSWMRSQGFTSEVFDGRPGDRDRDHLVGARAVQRAPAPGGRVGQARRVAGGRLPAGVPGDGAGGDAAASHGDAVQEPARDGGRGAHPRQPAGRRGAALRLRQDDAGTADGGLKRGATRDHGDRRPEAERQVPGDRRRLRHRGVALGGGPARRADDAGGVRVRRGVHVTIRRALHDDGHRVHDGVDGRGARHAAAVLGRPGRQWTPGGTRPRSGPARSSSAWSRTT